MSNSYDFPADSAHGYGFAADAAVAERVEFIRKTYLHLAGAILLFIGLTSFFLTNATINQAFQGFLFNGPGGFLGIFIGYMVVSWIASYWASHAVSPSMQYGGLLLYTIAEAVIFTPLLMIVQFQFGQAGGNELIMTAGMLTMMIFGGLTAYVLITKQDFSFLRSALVICSFAAFGLVLASWLFGFHSNLIIVGFFIVLMCGFILYDTSNVLHHYRTDQYVAASLALFAAMATLFWYMIRLLMILRGDD